MELIAPAGDLTKLKYALTFGADAVYCGTPEFSLRVRVNKFTQAHLAEGIAWAHERGKKVYVTLNVYLHNQQLDQAKKYLPRLLKLKPDALVVSDPGLLLYLRRHYPRQTLHLSTQANALNYGAIEFYKKQGVSRVILARETTLKEAAQIKKQVPSMELEYFGHGAMCVAYSGRCLLSSLFSGRSANEGDCTQPCRWPWRAEAATGGSRSSKAAVKNSTRRLILEEDPHGSYLLNSRDLCLIEHLDQFQKAKIDSLKIEGRNKSLYYLTTVVKHYARAIQARGQERKEVVRQALAAFARLNHRGYTTGFAFGPDLNLQNPAGAVSPGAKTFKQHQLKGEFQGVAAQDSTLAKIRVHNAILKGDQLQALSPKQDQTVRAVRILDHQLKPQKSAHGGTDKIWYIEFNKPLEPWTILSSS